VEEALRSRSLQAINPPILSHTHTHTHIHTQTALKLEAAALYVEEALQS